MLKYLLKCVAPGLPNCFRTALMSRLTLYCLIVLGAIAGIAAWQLRSGERGSGSADSDERLHAPAQFEPAESVLDAEKQQAIWDSEHATFEIETHLGQRFVQAVTDRSVDQLIGIFADDLRANVPDTGSSRLRTLGPLTERRTDVEAEPGLSVDRSELAAWLIAALEPIGDIDGGRLRVLQIEAVQDRKHEWDVELLWTAHGKTSDGQSAAVDSHHRATVRYVDHIELTQAATVIRWQVDSHTMRMSQQQLMTEVTSEVELDKVALPDNWNLPVEKQNLYNFQMAVADYDRDGFLDIVVASGSAGLKPILLKSEQGRRFHDVTPGSGLTPWSGPSFLVSWIDYDNDGFPDLLLGDRLYHNERGQSFTDVTEASAFAPGFNPMGCSVADFDVDGLLDLYIVYQVTPAPPEGTVPWVGDDESGAFNQLWHNEGNGRFRNITGKAHASGGGRESLAVTALFYDGDHFPDLYIANDFGPNVLLRNRGNGTFEDVSEQAVCSDFATSMGVSSGDLDNDGLAEIYVANMYSKMGRRIIAGVSADDYPPGVFEQIQGSCAGNTLYQRASLSDSFQETSLALEVNSVGWAFATAMADFNGDGWLDLYGTAGYRSFQRREPDG